MYSEDSQLTSQPDRPIFGLPVDTALLFCDKRGVHKQSIERKRTKLLAKVTFLRDILDPDEKIVFVTTGCSPFSALEQLTTGQLWLLMIKRALFVFTNKRILHIPTTTKYEYRGSIAQILYHDCRQLHVKGTTLAAEYQTGKKERFCGIPRADGAIIRQISIEAPDPVAPSDFPERNHICPSCTGILRPGTVACPGCGLEFKSKAKALRYSLLLPGGGYFYVRRWGMGIADALVESYLLIFALLTLGASAGGDPEALPLFFILAVGLAVEKLITVYHATNFLTEFIPCDPNARPARQETPPEQPPAPPTERKQTLEQVLSVR